MFKSLVTRGAGLPLHLQRFAFSGGHHVAPYDWRDDHAMNPHYEADPRYEGIPDPYKYSQPFERWGNPYQSPFLPEYNPKDLSTNYIGTFPIQSVAESNLLEPHHQNMWDDIAHEWDYESEDFDFQPENYKSQHFRKKGGLWIWGLVLFYPYIGVIQELVYNQMVDGDQNKFQRPPPLNFPDQEDTPDTETYENWQSGEFKYLWDSGILYDPFFQIVDGKKIYSKWGGTNQPWTAIK